MGDRMGRLLVVINAVEVEAGEVPVGIRVLQSKVNDSERKRAENNAAAVITCDIFGGCRH